MVPIRTIFNRAKDTYNDYEFDDIIIKGDPFKVYHIRKLNDLPEGHYQKRYCLKYLIIILLKMEKAIHLHDDLFKMSFMLAGMNAVDFTIVLLIRMEG